MAISMLNVTMFKIKGGVREGGREQEQEQFGIFLVDFLSPVFCNQMGWITTTVFLEVYLYC